MRARGAVAFGTALVAVLCAGIWLGGHPAELPEPIRDVFVGNAASLTAEATELIEEHYYRPVDGTELGNASLQGMVRQLRQRNDDRFSEYFSADSLADFNEAIEGHFSGIGLSVVPAKRGLRVTKVFRGSPASRGGIEAGEVVVSVDGEQIAGLSSTEATAMIKGPDGTEVRVGVLDPGSGKVRELELTRAEVALPNLSSKVQEVGGRKLGHVRMLSFSDGVHAQLANAVRKVERAGAEGIVLDLRGNGGGLLQEAVLTASVFLPEDRVVVSTDSRSEGHAVYRTVGGNLPQRPTVVLIDRNTASAAEILAAALADNAGAPVVGTRSFGKGVFQQEIGLANGGALKLTVGEYFTPAGVNLAGEGIQPDVKARDDPRTRGDEALARANAVLAQRAGA
jgi:carboxyl-terminal processing protease